MPYEHDAPTAPEQPRTRRRRATWSPAVAVAALAVWAVLLALDAWADIDLGPARVFVAVLLAQPLAWLFWTRRRS